VECSNESAFLSFNPLFLFFLSFGLGAEGAVVPLVFIFILSFLSAHGWFLLLLAEVQVCFLINGFSFLVWS
jgi:hypothetical protein